MKKTKMLFILASAALLASCGVGSSSSSSETSLPVADSSESSVEISNPISETTEESSVKLVYDMTGVTFADKSFTYDGSEKSLSIEGTLPNGVTVTYEGNGKTNVGEYEVTAHFAGDAAYEAIPDMRAKLTITKATYDLSGITFEDATVRCDGTAKSILIAGELPEGVTVTYTGNGQIDVGTYDVVAHFAGDEVNYEPIPDMTAKLTITTGVFAPRFEDATFDYDGQAKSIYLSNDLPAGIEVSYTGNEQTLPGVYQVTASFTVNDNFDPIEPVTATMTIVYKTYVYTRDDYAAKGVILERNEDNTLMTYKNGTSGILSGSNQNWGESGIYFWETIQGYAKFQETQSRYVKFDILFEDSVTSFNLRFGPALTEFYLTEVGFDTPFPWGRQLNVFDGNGKRVDRVSHNVWYTFYIEIIGDNMNTFWTNGGSPEAPAVAQIKNAECVKDLNPSLAPYVKEGAGSVSIATEEGREGSFKVENGGKAVNFFGITHTNSPDVHEFTGGFFDDNEFRYLVFDYWLDDVSNGWYLEAKGQGFSEKLGRYCSAIETNPNVTVYHGGEAVQYMQTGWNTCVVDMPHGDGGWTDFDLSLGGNIGYIRNAYYSKTPSIQ